MSDLKKVISIDLSDNTKQGFDNIEQTFKDVDNSIKKAEGTTNNLRTELKQLQKDLLSGKFTGEEFVQATNRAGELRDSIGDLNARIKVLGSDTRTLDGLIGAAEGIAGGFALAQGAAGLFGSENDALEKSLLKVQSSMAVLQGLQAVANTLQKESAARIAVTTAAQNLYTFAVGGSSGALKVFRLALAGTGIGLIVIALVELYQNFDKVKAAVLNLVPGLSLVGDFLGGIIDQVTDFVGITSDATREIDGLVKAAEKSAESSQRFLDTQGYKYDEYTKRKIQANLDYAANIKKTNEDEKLSEQQKLIDIKAYRDKADFEIAQADKDRATERQKKRDDEVAKEKEKADKIEKDRVTKFEKEKADTIANGDAIQASLNAIAQKRLDKEAENKAKADAIQQGLLEDGESPLDKLQRQYDEERAILEAAHQNTLLLDAKFVTDKKALEDQDTLNKQENAAAQEEIEAKKAAAREQWLAAGANTLNQASELLGRSTDAGKAAAIAAATIETYQSAVSSYNSLSGIPVVGPALGAVAAGVAVASGIANVKKILSVKTPKGGGGGGVPGGGSPVATPASPQAQFNIVGQSSNNQLAQTIAGAQQQPVQAFVVAGEVSTQQALDRNKIQNSTFL